MMPQKNLRIPFDEVLPDSLDELTDWVIGEANPYGALALHSFVNDKLKNKLEHILFENRRLLYVFAMAQYTPGSVLNVLASEPNEQLQLRVLKNPNTTANTLEKLYKNESSKKFIELIASHPNTSSDVLEKIEWQGSEKIRAALSSNSNTPLTVIKKLLIDSSLNEKKIIARHPELNSEILEILWNEGDEYLRAEVVSHSECPERLIVKAIKSRHVIERQKLASNPVIGDVIRYRLLIDEEPRVRAAIVKSQEVSEDELNKLCEDSSEQVRRNEARRKGLSEYVETQFVNDDDVWVRRWLARNAVTSDKVLEKLAIDEDENVRRSVARNKSCPKRLLGKLADDDSAWVRAGIALRSDISKEVLLKLANDQNIDIQSAIGINPITPVKILKRLAKNSDRDVRRSVILNENVTGKVLELFVEEPYPLNRIILASRKKCNRQTRWRLANDPDNEVRFSAIRFFAKQMFKTTIWRDNDENTRCN